MIEPKSQPLFSKPIENNVGEAITDKRDELINELKREIDTLKKDAELKEAESKATKAVMEKKNSDLADKDELIEQLTQGITVLK